MHVVVRTAVSTISSWGLCVLRLTHQAKTATVNMVDRYFILSFHFEDWDETGRCSVNFAFISHFSKAFEKLASTTVGPNTTAEVLFTQMFGIFLIKKLSRRLEKN